MNNTSVYAIGLMSGSSLDGLDIAYVRFDKALPDAWHYEILAAECMPFPPTLLHKLSTASTLPAKELFLIHTQLGHFFGNAVRYFVDSRKLEKLDFVASHGHTVFHDPENMMTCQLGDGAAIAISSGFTTISDLRSSDIAAGGQGAPIVPMGDLHLFSDYDAWLNIGGICNISKRDVAKNIIAYDIGVANQVLNYYAKQAGKEYDEDGVMARSGRIDMDLCARLSVLDYYHKAAPKSLDNAFIHQEILPLLEATKLSVADKLASYTYHIASEMAKHCEGQTKVLATGGGALNKFLIEQIQAQSTATIVVPDRLTVQYKEALVMAFLGLLRMQGEPNVLASVTGARRNTVNGAVYLP